MHGNCSLTAGEFGVSNALTSRVSHTWNPTGDQQTESFQYRTAKQVKRCTYSVDTFTSHHDCIAVHENRYILLWSIAKQ